MLNEEEKLKTLIRESKIDAVHLRFGKSLHTVEDTLRVTGFELRHITKTMIFKGPNDERVAAMVPARYRVSVSSLAAATGIAGLELATPAEAHEITGYPVGGMPCFGYAATLVIDPAVFEQGHVYTGGGSEFSLVRITTEELKRMANPVVRKIRGKKSN